MGSPYSIFPASPVVPEIELTLFLCVYVLFLYNFRKFFLSARRLHVAFTLWCSQFSSVAQLCPTLCDPQTAAREASLSITNSRSLLKLISIQLVMPPNHLILRHPLLLLPSIFPSVRVFSNESVLRIRWPTYWSFSFSISPSNEHPGLISFRMDWLDLLAVQGTLKSLLQHHGSKSSNSSVLSFLHSPTLTSIRDRWKNHCFD